MHDLRVAAAATGGVAEPPIDPAELDTIVVPARKEDFETLFLGEHLWRPVRIQLRSFLRP